MLKTAWGEYSAILATKSLPMQQSVLDKREYILQENHSIQITVNNNIELQQLTKLKGGLLPYLKEKLNNHFIEINGQIKALKQGERQPYTPQEKFEAVAKEYPALLTLKEAFGLDMDAE